MTDISPSAPGMILSFVAALMISVALVWLLYPILGRYALARPNERSGHHTPTPQGGGIAVIGSVLIVIGGIAYLAPESFNDPTRLAIVFCSTVGLAIVGATDDIRPLEAFPRLLLQAIAVAIVIATLPAEFRIIPILPWWIERVCILIGGVWFVNLVNFMDGLDWMTVAEIVPLTVGIALFGLSGALPPQATIIAVALCGATIGFAPFNRPVARLFLGDVGSLPIGLLLGWLLVLLAGGGHLAAALLLPLYYVADSTITLFRRLINREQLMLAHREHYYQRALDRGIGIYRIVGSVFVLNILLLLLAAATLISASTELHVLALSAGGVGVGTLLWHFNSARR